ncbi:MAG: beta strand repeat-containing protein [Elainella sp.]
MNDIRIDATSSVQMQNSELLNLIEAGATGNSGNVIVVADSLSLLNGARIQTTISQAANGQPAGRGQAGNIDIAVDNDLTLAGRNQSDRFSALNSSLESGATGGAGNVTVRAGSIRLDDAGIFSEVQSRAFGNGGTVTVTADSLSLSNGSQLSTSVLGTQGQAGDITLRINGVTELVGQDRNRVPSSLFSSLGTGSVGRAGNIDIRTGALSMQSGTRLNSSTSGQGNAGNVEVTVNEVAQLDNADIFSRVEAGAVGDGGDVTVHAGSMSLLNGSWVQTAVRPANDEGQPAGRGQAGDILIAVDDGLLLAGRNQAGVSSRLDSSLESGATGGAGNVTVRAGRIQLDDAAIFSTVDSEAVGNAGNIDIRTGTLSMQNETILSSSTSGQGNAGNVTVTATGAINLGNNANIFSNVARGAVGNGGNITVAADSLSLLNGSQIQTRVLEAEGNQRAGQGQAGDIVLRINNALTLAGRNSATRPSLINSSLGSGSTGRGGNIDIRTGTLSMQEGTELNSSTSGQGDAGNVVIVVDGALQTNNADIFSRVNAGGTGDGGDVTIRAGSMSLLNGSGVQTAVRQADDEGQPAGRGQAGDILITVDDDLFLTGRNRAGVFSRLDSSLESGATGGAGNVTVRAGRIQLDDAAIFSTVNSEAVGNGGNVRVLADSASLRRGSQILTSVGENGQGRAGDIVLRVNDTLTLAEQDRNDLPNIVSSRLGAGATGRAGNIDVQTDTLLMQNGSIFNSSTSGRGNAGDVEVTARQVAQLDYAGLLSRVESGAVGNGGNVRVSADSLFLLNGSQVQTLVFGEEDGKPAGQGRAGNVRIIVADGLVLSGRGRDQQENPSAIFSSNLGQGEAGDIAIRSQNIRLDEGQINTDGVGDGGSIEIDSSGALTLRRGSRISAFADGGSGGNIDINTGLLVAIPSERSYITASAGEGRGGQVTINADSVLGIQPFDREQLEEFYGTTDVDLSQIPSSITAVSQTAPQLSGTVEINTPNLDPAQGLVELSTTVVDASQQLAQTCPADANPEEQGSFVRTGRSGLPATPTDPLGSQEIAAEWYTPTEVAANNVAASLPADPPEQIIEAQGWVKHSDGSVEMVAAGPTNSPVPAFESVSCHE